MQTVPVPDIRAAMALLEKTPFLFETLLRDLPADVLQWKPAPDRWSISEVLVHLADIEQVYAQRVRRIMAEDSPELQKYDRATSAGGDYAKGSAADHLARFTASRLSIVAFFASIPAASGARIARHSELGIITLSQLLNEWASHDLGHLRQIAELYRARAFHPHSGPFQKYSNLKP
jgi:hypothetical protein